jgi:hypothetical protein
MSIADSIFARDGRPQPTATVVRIPIQGAFTTLAVVQLRDASVLPGTTINRGQMQRFELSVPSNFVLSGFDQRSPPAFQHSTTGFLSYMATGDDATFVYAIDAVSARFDEVGRYWVDYHSALLNDREVAAASLSLTSWVLVNEPPIDAKQARAVWPATIGPIAAAASRFSIPLVMADSCGRGPLPSDCS